MMIHFEDTTSTFSAMMAAGRFKGLTYEAILKKTLVIRLLWAPIFRHDAWTHEHRSGKIVEGTSDKHQEENIIYKAKG